MITSRTVVTNIHQTQRYSTAPALPFPQKLTPEITNSQHTITQPTMSLDLSIPKIETESKGDILHLTSTLSTAASTKLSKCIANKELAAAKSLGSKFADNEFVEEKRRVCAGHLSEVGTLYLRMRKGEC